MGVFVIACFKPKPGKEKMLLDVVRDHLPVLRKEGLVTEKQSLTMKSKEGSIVEVFEWKSEKAIEEAHKSKTVLELWKRFEESSDYIPVASIEEAKHVFSNFEPVEL